MFFMVTVLLMSQSTWSMFRGRPGYLGPRATQQALQNLGLTKMPTTEEDLQKAVEKTKSRITGDYSTKQRKYAQLQNAFNTISAEFSPKSVEVATSARQAQERQAELDAMRHDRALADLDAAQADLDAAQEAKEKSTESWSGVRDAAQEVKEKSAKYWSGVRDAAQEVKEKSAKYWSGVNWSGVRDAAGVGAAGVGAVGVGGAAYGVSRMLGQQSDEEMIARAAQRHGVSAEALVVRKDPETGEKVVARIW